MQKGEKANNFALPSNGKCWVLAKPLPRPHHRFAHLHIHTYYNYRKGRILLSLTWAERTDMQSTSGNGPRERFWDLHCSGVASTQPRLKSEGIFSLPMHVIQKESSSHSQFICDFVKHNLPAVQPHQPQLEANRSHYATDRNLISADLKCTVDNCWNPS